MNWDGWVGSADGRPTFFKKRLAGILGWTVRLHKFIAPDDPGCWHTHPAHAVRVVVWGGYIEETPDGRLRAWLPGMVGRIRPEFAHRVAGIQNGRASYSLWFHGPRVARIALVGQCAEGHVAGRVKVTFPKPVAWIALRPEEAIAFAQLLIDHAKAAGLREPVTLTL